MNLPVTVSFNGSDNVGKTTHLRWLALAWPDAAAMGKVDRWSDDWQAVRAGDFTRWWFQDSSTEEHIRLILDSHTARRRASPSLALEDRGLPMLVASCAATAVVKDRLTPQAALDRVERLADEHPVPPRREIHLLLRHSALAREADLALIREPRALSAWYGPYQRALAEILDLQRARGDYDVVIVRGDRPALEVQHDVRLQLRQYGLGPPPWPSLGPSLLWLGAGGEGGTGPDRRDHFAAAPEGLGPEARAELVTEMILRQQGQAVGVTLAGVDDPGVRTHLSRIWGSRLALRDRRGTAVNQ